VPGDVNIICPPALVVVLAPITSPTATAHCDERTFKVYKELALPAERVIAQLHCNV
jgi:hypothetical protein